MGQILAIQWFNWNWNNSYPVLSVLILLALFVSVDAKSLEKNMFTGEIHPDDSLEALFPVKQQYFIPGNSKKVSEWNPVRFNNYGYDVTKLEDSVEIDLQGFVFPFKGKKGSGFGPRFLLGHSFHYGLDIDLNVGDTVVAAMDGIVRISRYDRGGFGKCITIIHKNGLETVYAHHSALLVKEGQEVKAGSPIALGGSTGLSTGPHLHFEMRFMGAQFDPARVIDYDSLRVKQPKFMIDASWFEHFDAHKRTNIALSGAGKYHVVRSGDTLGAIANRYRTNVSRICRLNGISSRTILRPGKRLRVI